MQATDVTRTAAKATAAAVAVVALAFGLWKVRSIVILLLLALTFAAAIRPGVEWLRRRHVPQSVAIFFFFALVLGAIGLFFWLAVPPALHQLSERRDDGTRCLVPVRGDRVEQLRSVWKLAELAVDPGEDIVSDPGGVTRCCGGPALVECL